MAKGSLILRRAQLGAIAACVFSATVVSAGPLDTEIQLRGIQLGAVAAEAFPACPPDAEPFTERAQPCLIQDAKPSAVLPGLVGPMIIGLPKVLGVGTVASVKLLEGRIEQIELAMLSTSYTLMLESLSNKFGAPATQSVHTFQTGLGRILEGRTAKWVGSGAVLDIEERRVGKADYGFITLRSGRMLDVMRQQRKEQAQAATRGL